MTQVFWEDTDKVIMMQVNNNPNLEDTMHYQPTVKEVREENGQTKKIMAWPKECEGVQGMWAPAGFEREQSKIGRE